MTNKPKQRIAEITRRVHVRRCSTTELHVPVSFLRALLKVPEDARLYVRVPSGGDWSGTDLDLNDATQCLAVTYTTTTEEEQ